MAGAPNIGRALAPNPGPRRRRSDRAIGRPRSPERRLTWDRLALVRLRQLLGDTERQFSRRVGISVYKVIRYENGGLIPDAQELAQIANRTNTSLLAFYDQGAA